MQAQADRGTGVRRGRNSTGLPNALKRGIEDLSGVSLDDVKVHYNSSKPAQLQALAYTRGRDIHVGPGQERHLAHEAWHVVQQKQGRVAPTFGLGTVGINDDPRLEAEATHMGARALQIGQGSALQLHRAPDQALTTSGEVAQLLDMETPDGVWHFTDYAIQNRAWRGLTEHTLTYTPNVGVGNNRIVLVQAIQSYIDGEVISTDRVAEGRISEATGFRIDNFTDSNNPVFGAPSGRSLADTPASGDTFTVGGRRNRGTRGRPNIVEQLPSRLDNPGFGLGSLRRQNALNEEMGQTLITAAYNATTRQYLGSIAYGWHQPANGAPELLTMTFTTGGVSNVFASALEQWNMGTTGGAGNINLPVPEGVEVRDFEREEDLLDEAMDVDTEDDIEMGEELQGIAFEQWLHQIQVWFFAEYGAGLRDYPDQPYRLMYEEGMSALDFYNQFLANGRAL